MAEARLVQLPLSSFRLQFSGQPSDLPAYSGSAWRGALGHALKRTVCVTRERDCKQCLLYRSCPYPYIFDTPPPADSAKMRRYTSAPHPFVLAVPGPQKSSQGERLLLGLTLIGHGNHYLPYLIEALRRAGEEGVGPGRVSYRLEQVEQAQAAQWQRIYAPGEPLSALPPVTPGIPACPGRMRLHLLTPLRLTSESNPLRESQFSFAALFSNLLRRVSMLSHFHTATPLETDFAGLKQQAHAVPALSSELRWHDWARYSSRQQRLIKMGGLIGHFEVDLSGRESLWPYIFLGQYVHAGHGTSMGLGRYRIEADDAPLALRAPDAFGDCP